MEPHPYTDSAGREWRVFDYKVINSGAEAKKRAVPVGHWSAEARAFAPANAAGAILIYSFNATPYRDTEPRTLEDQLRFAKPLHSTAAERMTGRD